MTASLAVAIALAGAIISGAAVREGDQVVSSDIRDREVKAPDLGRGAVTGEKAGGISVGDRALDAFYEARVEVVDPSPGNGNPSPPSRVFRGDRIRMTATCERGADETHANIFVRVAPDSPASFSAFGDAEAAGRLSPGTGARLSRLPVDPVQDRIVSFQVGARREVVSGVVMVSGGSNPARCEILAHVEKT